MTQEPIPTDSVEGQANLSSVPVVTGPIELPTEQPTEQAAVPDSVQSTSTPVMATAESNHADKQTCVPRYPRRSHWPPKRKTTFPSKRLT